VISSLIENLSELLLQGIVNPVSMKQLSICFLAQIIIVMVSGQSVRFPLNCVYTSAGVYSTRFSDVFAAAANPGSLARLNNLAGGVYMERKFMLKELAYYQVIVAMPSKKGGFSLSLHYSGNTLFNELQAGVGYGRKLSDKIDLGARINYCMINAGNYGVAATLNAEAGTIWHINKELHLGFHVYNPVAGRFGKEANEKIPAIYKTGLGYEVSEKVFLCTEIVKEENLPANINITFQYKFIDQFFIKTGLATFNGQFFVGTGFRWDKLQIDVVSSWHQQLGFTPSIVFIFGSISEK